MNKIKVIKIGGAALDFESGFDSFISIVDTLIDTKAIVVISAIGKTTSILKNIAEAAKAIDIAKPMPCDNASPTINYLNHKELLAELHENYLSLARKNADVFREAEPIINQRFAELERIIKGIHTIRELSPRILDKVLAYGEILTGEILDILLQTHTCSHCYIPANKLIISNNTFGNAEPIEELFHKQYEKLITPALQKHEIILTQGYIAATETGDNTTMGFESSNFSAALIAAKAGASELEVWTDSPGIRQADPKIFPKAKIIKNMSYSQAIVLADLGLKLLHHGMIETALETGMILKYTSVLSNSDMTIISKDAETCMPLIIIRKPNVVTENSFEFIFYNADLELILKISKDLYPHLEKTEAIFLEIPVFKFYCKENNYQLVVDYLSNIIE